MKEKFLANIEGGGVYVLSQVSSFLCTRSLSSSGSAGSRRYGAPSFQGTVDPNDGVYALTIFKESLVFGQCRPGRKARLETVIGQLAPLKFRLRV